MHTLTGVPVVGVPLHRRRRRVAPLTPAYYKEKPSARVIPFDKLSDRTLTPAYNKERPLRGPLLSPLFNASHFHQHESFFNSPFQLLTPNCLRRLMAALGIVQTSLTLLSFAH